MTASRSIRHVSECGPNTPATGPAAAARTIRSWHSRSSSLIVAITMMACSLREQLRSYQRGRLRLGKRACSGQPVPALFTRPVVHVNAWGGPAALTVQYFRSNQLDSRAMRLSMAIHYGIAKKDGPKIAFQTRTECQ